MAQAIAFQGPDFYLTLACAETLLGAALLARPISASGVIKYWLSGGYSYDNVSRLLSVLHQAASTTLDGARLHLRRRPAESPQLRWDAVNERIKNLTASLGPGSAWHVQRLRGLCSQLFSEYLLLKRAYGSENERDSSLLASSARNLAGALRCGPCTAKGQSK